MSVSRTGQRSTNGNTGLLDRGARDGQASPAGQREQTPTTYYGRPMIKKPTWKWPIPLYFFVGGVAGGAALIGAVADLLGGARHRSTVRHARFLAFALAVVCPIFLIQDLGRKARFHHMLRVFKVRSPMSVGTWILTSFGLISGALAAKQAAEDGVIVPRDSRLGRVLRGLPGKPLSLLHGVFGLGLGGYTGVLLAATAVPLWAAGGLLMGPLFLATAVASGAAALSLLGRTTGHLSEEAHHDLAAVETISTCAQIGLVAAREMIVPARIKRPLHRGFWGAVFQ
ncbi:MAG TPA: NrfD/PsrC family molybdoenzyme membrane anchor subunit, partial [Ktedonobacterales bacterium]|nr:NrfD/PsrC family molybdoenzyme membrane anchor subunit [Ktedonobacterales bacterium]